MASGPFIVGEKPHVLMQRVPGERMLGRAGEKGFGKDAPNSGPMRRSILLTLREKNIAGTLREGEKEHRKRGVRCRAAAIG